MDHQAPEYPIISIITPSFNQGQFLAETIESVISQEGDFTIDYMIIDGGSNDNSLDIIKQYYSLLKTGGWPLACQGITYRWVSEKDNGQADALMKGFRLATGEIFAWLNSDDTYLPGTLQTAADFFRDHRDKGLMYGDAYYCDAVGTIIGKYRTEDFDLDTLASFNFICQPSAFFRRDVFEEVGGLDTTLHFAMDYDLWIRIGKHYPCSYLPQLLSTYRLHEDSKTIRAEALFENSEESLRLAMKHFNWAPLTRVASSCNLFCTSRLPRILAQNRPFLALATGICSVIRSLWLNRGFSRRDLKLMTRENFRKLLKSRDEIMTGTGNNS